MSVVRHAVVGVLCAWLAPGAGEAWAQTAPVRLLEVQKAVSDATKGKEALAQLASLPLGERQTVEYHVSLGRAARNADLPAKVAEAVGILKLLPAQVAPRSIGLVGAELPLLRTYLVAKSNELYNRAIAAQASGDLKTAVKSYLVAVKCDPAIMSRDDRGLGQTGLNALRKLAAKRPDKPDLSFQLGYYSYVFGDMAGAIAALQDHQKTQTDPYLRWRAGVWLAMIQADQKGTIDTDGTRPGGAVVAAQPVRN